MIFSSNKRIGATSLFIFLFIISFDFAHAQISPTASTRGIYMEKSTNFPRPEEKITITAKSNIIDLPSSNITWTIDGVVTKRGTGETKIETNAPKLGKTTTIKVNATTPGGLSYSDTLTISPIIIDIVVETDGYTPPFFKGKNPVIHQNKIKITAVPYILGGDGKPYDQSKLVYEWKKDGLKKIEEQSGYGKQSVEIIGSEIPRPFYLSVVVSTPDNRFAGEAIVPIETVFPGLLFYTNDPLYGPLYNKAITGTVKLNEQREFGAIVAPYGFNTTLTGLEVNSGGWTINGSFRPELAIKPSVVFRAPAESGESSISFELQNPNKIMQRVRGQFLVKFTNEKNSKNAF